MNLGSTIRNLRKQRRLTQDEFSSKCGITQTYLSQIENNLKDPNFSTLKIIGEQMDIPLPILFFLSMTDDDIHPDKRKAFEIVSPSIKSLVNEFFSL